MDHSGRAHSHDVVIPDQDGLTAGVNGNNKATSAAAATMAAAPRPFLRVGADGGIPEANPYDFATPATLSPAGGSGGGAAIGASLASLQAPHLHAPPLPRANVAASVASSVDFRSRQLALLGPQRPQPTKIWRRKFVKVMVVGDSGIGKTTLINALLSKPGEQLSVHDGTNTPLGQFLRDAESLVTRVTWKDEQDKVVWVFRVQDTPGYGDDQDIGRHVDMIVGHVNAQNDKWLRLESARDRCVDLAEVEDPRVDLVLYCLPPHRLRQNDVRYMATLSQHAPIVPVIMKADTMTIGEATRFRQEVVNRLQNPSLSGVRGKIRMFEFSPGTLERAGVPDGAAVSVPPFVVIASNEVNQAALQDDPPTYWPERSYRWGTAEAFNPEHSDLLFLRALLTAEALEEVVVSKRQRYEAWRSRQLATPLLARVRRQLVRFALATALPAAAVVFAANHGFDRRRMRDTLADAGRGARARLLPGSGDEPAARGAAAGAAGGREPLDSSAATAAALRDAEQAVLAAEAAQKKAFEELRARGGAAATAAPVPSVPAAKRGWFGW